MADLPDPIYNTFYQRPFFSPFVILADRHLAHRLLRLVFAELEVVMISRGCRLVQHWIEIELTVLMVNPHLAQQLRSPPEVLELKRLFVPASFLLSLAPISLTVFLHI
jgi:hypothetical protein